MARDGRWTPGSITAIDGTPTGRRNRFNMDRSQALDLAALVIDAIDEGLALYFGGPGIPTSEVPPDVARVWAHSLSPGGVTPGMSWTVWRNDRALHVVGNR